MPEDGHVIAATEPRACAYPALVFVSTGLVIDLCLALTVWVKEGGLTGPFVAWSGIVVLVMLLIGLWGSWDWVRTALGTSYLDRDGVLEIRSRKGAVRSVVIDSISAVRVQGRTPNLLNIFTQDSGARLLPRISFLGPTGWEDGPAIGLWRSQDAQLHEQVESFASSYGLRLARTTG